MEVDVTSGRLCPDVGGLHTRRTHSGHPKNTGEDCVNVTSRKVNRVSASARVSASYKLRVHGPPPLSSILGASGHVPEVM